MTSPIRLSAADQRNLQSAIATLLACGSHRSFLEWRLAVNSEFKRVLDSDTATFYTAMPSGTAAVSEDIARIREFVPLVSPLSAQFRLSDRELALGAWDRRTLWGRDLVHFVRSSYYNDFVRPIRALDAVGLAVRAGGAFVTLHLHRCSASGPRFGARSLALLRLLEPAFRVAAELALAHFCADAASSVSSSQPERHASLLVPRRDGRDVAAGQSHASPVPPPSRQPVLLSGREREVASLLAARRSNREIGELLGISSHTAKRHTENVLRKLGLQSRRAVERVVEQW